jgi:hypothetical protein
VESRRPTGLELALLIVIVLVIAGAALVGDGEGGSESSAARSDGSAGRSVRLDVAKIKRRVERMRGLSFRKPLSISFASPKRAQAIMEAATEGEYGRRDMLIDEEEMKLLGLLPASDHLDRYVRAIEEEQVLGFYDDRSKRLVVVRGNSGGRALQEITLAHELNHALEDQHFGIVRSEGLSDDRGFAETALFEGTATSLMIDYGARYFSPDDALDVLGDVGGTETKLPGFIEDQLIFPYEQGERFVDWLRLGGSWRAVDKVMRFRRPRTSEQVMHFDKYAQGEDPVNPTLPDAGRVLGSGWKRLDATTIGELDLRLLFEHGGRLSAADSARAAAGWGGGLFELWRRPGSGPCPGPCSARDAATLAVAWDSQRNRAQAESALRKVIERGLEGKPMPASREIELWSSRGGAVGLTTRGRQLTIALAPDTDTVARLLR